MCKKLTGLILLLLAPPPPPPLLLLLFERAFVNDGEGDGKLEVLLAAAVCLLFLAIGESKRTISSVVIAILVARVCVCVCAFSVCVWFWLFMFLCLLYISRLNRFKT